MHTSPIEPVHEAPGRLKTYFPIVPIEQVPVAESLAGAIADRPMVLVWRRCCGCRYAGRYPQPQRLCRDCGLRRIDAVATALLVPPDLVIADATLRIGAVSR